MYADQAKAVFEGVYILEDNESKRFDKYSALFNSYGFIGLC